MSEVRSYSAEAHEPSAADTLMEAFRADPIFRGVMVDDADYNSMAPIMFGSFSGLLMSAYGTVDVVEQNGAAVAVAQWEPAAMSLNAGLRMLVAIPKLCWAMGYKKSVMMLKMFAVLESKRHELGGNAHHLMTLGTNPEQQGKGMGSILIKKGIARATELGVPCYLESSNPKNIPFYLRHGFVEVGKYYPYEKDGVDGNGAKIEGKGPVLTFMYRELDGGNLGGRTGGAE
ncbi:hypothetical protein TrST_g5891 [Triparma strigata]|uniref:N-acetyltransferase domain-containing protein n=1 Tax=Triparma strigata TaxID=1606541 RepID=A0A9W6ZXV6_9STRA|nr:hypothetical protein TrST_g5891 [Triparma strigata]